MLTRSITLYGRPELIEAVSDNLIMGKTLRFDGIKIAGMGLSMEKMADTPHRIRVTLRCSEEGRNFEFNGYASEGVVESVRYWVNGSAHVALAGERLSKKHAPKNYLYAVNIMLPEL